MTLLPADGLRRLRRERHPISVAESGKLLFERTDSGGSDRFDEMLRALLAPAVVLTQEDIGQNSDYKEALLCAVIGHETWHARQGAHPSVTGARKPVILGQITPGANYVDLIRQTWCDR